MKFYELKLVAGSEKAPKEVGRGTGSGLDRNTKKSGKSQNARSGGGVRPGSKGGQISLYRKLPKRGSANILTRQYVSVSADRLNIFEDGTEITPEVLPERRVINKVEDGVKILGSGTLEKSLTIRGRKFSKSAAERIEVAGGKVEVI